ncbi:MAG: hypothetical protein ACRDOK_24000 [Streptosporangiaceae bacterium]
MTLSKHRHRTRHLVDPEVAAGLDDFPPFNFTTAALSAIRARLSQPIDGARDPALLFPGLTRSKHHVRGLGGDPEVGVLLYEPADGAAVRLSWSGFMAAASSWELPRMTT